MYEDEASLLNRVMRPALYARRELAVQEVRRRKNPSVLDVGCGSGRVAEALLEAGAERYLGIDFSEPMLALSAERLAAFESKIELMQGDFRTANFKGKFDVVVALGLFDYLEDPHTFTRRMREVCADGGCMVGTFGRWDWFKGPMRVLRYEVINSCPIFHFTRRELELLLNGSGFSRLEIDERRSGFYVRAYA
ncbi:MAG: class I SAM-dependent methyltransferase [Polyangiaceae bacterium]